MRLAYDPALSIGPEAAAFGEMPLAPYELTHRTEAELASDMAEHLRVAQPTSGAEALRTLRGAFPNSPLSARVAALAALMRR